jgi:hypothetical protein
VRSPVIDLKSKKHAEDDEDEFDKDHCPILALEGTNDAVVNHFLLRTLAISRTLTGAQGTIK